MIRNFKRQIFKYINKLFINNLENQPVFLEKALNKRDYFFIHIGANNGEDPFSIFREQNKWKGIFVEPQTDIFNILKEKFGHNEKYKFENIAISSKSENKILYKIAFSRSKWAHTLASFNKELVLEHFRSGYISKMSREDGIFIPKEEKDWITEEIVACTTFRALLNKYNIIHIDVLITDTEGYDYHLVKDALRSYINPNIIIFEYIHINPYNQIKLFLLLKLKGYNLYKLSSDILAIQYDV